MKVSIAPLILPFFLAAYVAATCPLNISSTQAVSQEIDETSGYGTGVFLPHGASDWYKPLLH